VLTVAPGCERRDTSITHGADGAPEWSRHLAAAVPLGISADSARRIIESNGFHCHGADTIAHFWCDKLSRKAIVQRRWQAAFDLDAKRRVDQVRGFTGLIGP
jgi:hypothetical protein